MNSTNYRLQPLGMPAYEGPPLDPIKLSVSYFISSPNMHYIPDFRINEKYVYIRKNGRFYTHDFTLWPQWYFEATKHFPLVQHRPPADKLATDDLRMLWYDMTDADFIREPGMVAEVGRIRPNLAKEFNDMRVVLSRKIDELIQRLDNHLDEFRDFRYAQHAMLLTTIALEHAPQNRLMTLLTVTGFQCFYLESLAFYNFYSRWNDVLSSASQKQPVDISIMGAATCHFHVAQMFCQAGVSVWLFRAPYQITSSIKVASNEYRMSDFDSLVKAVYPNTACIMYSSPSAIRNRASQVMRVASVSIGPSAYEVRLGDPLSTSCRL